MKLQVLFLVLVASAHAVSDHAPEPGPATAHAAKPGPPAPVHPDKDDSPAHAHPAKPSPPAHTQPAQPSPPVVSTSSPTSSAQPSESSPATVLPPPDALDSGNTGANGGKSWSNAFAKAQAVVMQMTIEEMANLTTGTDGLCVGNTGSVPRLNIPSLCLEDGPVGVRGAHGVSQFPAGLTSAATWDRNLIYARSKAMGQEFRDQGVHIPLAPVTGGPLGRSVLNGRAWEGTFADPYACGEASYQAVAGMLNSSVAPVAKHFIAYEQETFRDQYSAFPAPDQAAQLPISSNVDDKTTHEVYLWAFTEAVRAGTSHIMCSYNRINDTHACANAYSLNYLLKTELNFQGSVVSDWGGQWDNVDSARNGLDMGMPGFGYGGFFGSFWGSNMVDMVNNGTITEQVLRDKVIRILTSYYHLGMDINPLPDVGFNALFPLSYFPDRFRNVRKPGTTDLIREIGSSSVTLLKNTGGLPLNNPQRIAVLGNDASDNVLGVNACGSYGSGCDYQNLNGTLTTGGGSGSSFAPYIITPIDALKQRAIETGAEIGAVISQSGSAAETAAISELLRTADATLVFVNRYSAEAVDIPDLSIPEDQDFLIAQAVNYSSNVVLVIHSTGVVDIEKWVENENVTAIVMAYLPGQEAGAGLIPVLYGDISPSGKLPWTWGKSIDDYPPNGIIDDPVFSPEVNFTEGAFIDYRWFDQKNITPRYEFGFGLSYTTFDYSELVIDCTGSSDNTSYMATAEKFAESDGTNSLYDVLFTASAVITNSGNVTGSEVAQLYISIPEEGQPIRMLRGFDKVKDIKAGACATASFAIRRKDVSVWSVVDQQWYVPNGTFTIAVGGSSRNLPLSVTWTP
ncbi:beta-D-xylosidase/beta-D-glucosidase [Rhodocollybia butyracea]|uniref:Probable beta-glucosidase G n=1 Tax=Rhodocollybia butyracea TaxID=206335 RepID=A0A9P5U464_9AGAR|nr:beta-D-xylosidase/beta-D-glucosidase [Rhodocollybia butyracea]